jgi:hypothetical protein
LAFPLLYLNIELRWDSRNANMKRDTKVLSLGIETWRNAVSRALAVRRKSGFWGVNNYWNLCALPEAASVDVAVFHHSFALHDLRYGAEYIRRRWPNAVILVIGEQAEQLDDPLYDDKASSGISIKELVSMIETSVATRRRVRRNVRSGLGNARQ